MERVVGTVARGLRCPIIHEGDPIEEIVVDTVLKAAKIEGFTIQERDIVSITESIVARAQGNYVTIDHIAEDIHNKFGDDTIGVIFPILSRNRFGTCLRGIAKGAKKIVLMLSYPSDEEAGTQRQPYNAFDCDFRFALSARRDHRRQACRSFQPKIHNHRF